MPTASPGAEAGDGRCASVLRTARGAKQRPKIPETGAGECVRPLPNATGTRFACSQRAQADALEIVEHSGSPQGSL